MARPPIALLSALSLLAGVQALAPASAAATDDQAGCVSGMDWAYFETGGEECSKDGSGGDGSSEGGGLSSSEPNSCSVGDGDLPPGTQPGELVCVKGDAYVPGGRPLGLRPGLSVGGEGDRILGARRGVAAGSRPTPAKRRKKPERPIGQWPPKRVQRRADSLRKLEPGLVSCVDFYLTIQKYYWENAKLETREWGLGHYLTARPVSSWEFRQTEEAWEEMSCPGPVPTDET
jgi:hypothetical protein